MTPSIHPIAPQRQQAPRQQPLQMRMSASRAMPLRAARFWIICGFFLFWSGLITGRLFWLQIVRHSEYVERAQRQQQRTFEIAPRRGVLYDRNLRELAMTVQADSVYAVPIEMDDRAAAARALAPIVHVDPEDSQTTEPEIEKRLNAGHGFAWVARRVSPETSAKVKALGMKGVYFQKEFERVYPDNEIAAQVLGYVGVDDNGLGGLEQKFDGELHGEPGRVYTAMDARRHWLGSTEHEPEPGENLVLTIDENIQFLAERALDDVMAKEHADNGTVVVQDVHTGQILALAMRPTFNPNQSRHTTTALLKDHAVSDVYEPGSVFKLVAYSAAIDQGLVKPDDMVDCQGGSITLFGRTIHDNQGEHYGVIPVHQALEVSSDVAAIKMALKVGQNKFSEYIRNYGFGSRTGIELPGETRGLLRSVNKWQATSIGSIAIGQEVGVTPLQLVSMVSTIANGGVYLPPHILMPAPKAQPGEAAPQLQPAPFKTSEDLPDPLPSGAHRVISTLAAAQMRKMMEGVVLFGSGHPAQLNGYSAGGKTGTAQKIDPATHLYSKTMHIASFAGIAPVNDPVISVAVVIDDPRVGSYYGTAVSAPVFADVAQHVLEYLGVPHDIEVRAPKTTTKPEKPAVEDAQEDVGDINALFAAANDLPSDDPLRIQAAQGKPAAPQAADVVQAASAPEVARPAEPTQAQSKPPQPANGTVDEVEAVDDEKPLKVPSLIGLSVRQVIEVSQAAGLRVQMSGSGTAREQAPAAGAMVSPHTHIVVKCAR